MFLATSANVPLAASQINHGKTQVGRFHNDGHPRSEQGVSAPPSTKGHANPRLRQISYGKGGGDNLQRNASEDVCEQWPLDKEDKGENDGSDNKRKDNDYDDHNNHNNNNNYEDNNVDKDAP